MSNYNNSKFQIRLPLILCIGIAAGILIGANFTDSPSSKNDLSTNLQKFKEVLTLIDKDYVDEVNVNKLVDDAIEQMLTELDPHSAYIPASDVKMANEDLKGNFEGIGVEFNIFKDTIVVVTPLSGGPSEAVGVMSGDRIIKIDGKDVAGVGFTNRDVQTHLKGEKGSHVLVTVKRKNKKEPIEFDITRDKIPQQSVDASYMLSDKMGYIKINRFSATTYEEFIEALKKLKKEGMSQLILDLQGNPGGYMNHAIKVADEFLKDGERIVYTKGKQSRFDQEADASKKGVFEKGDLIVLINEGSASASEIVTGALQDNDRALIVGRRSFGKGLVQAPMDLSDGSELRLTISRYYTPSGRSIQKPYDDRDDYAKDIVERYNNGEFFSADSIHFNDSLKYQTTHGRVVYGGGGIMPDYFVPLDTAMNSPYLNELFNSNSIQEYTFNYVAKHKDELEKQGFKAFFKDFVVTDGMFKDLEKIGLANGIKAKPTQIKEYRGLFQLHMKAQIARQVWGNDGFYPIYNQTNEVLQQAMKLFDQAEKLEHSKM